MFAALKIIATTLLAGLSVLVAVLRSNHPGLVVCTLCAFALGMCAAEAYRAYRQTTVRAAARLGY